MFASIQFYPFDLSSPHCQGFDACRYIIDTLKARGPPMVLFISPILIGSMYGIYANIGGILMVNVTIYIYSIHGSYGIVLVV